ncbi:hypothetical protein JG491_08720 [Streptomyces sp. CRPSP2-6A1]|uniref:hypothetical protein n=1 Tax=Streptomyces sp. CRPSP2-6A1 TaxID=2799588 RepID=UPI0018F087A6|nr:hypothetical protein [Streptomyces sp. CRPSP2-6A1]MBJ7000155.1 hypothetical protein [Streptomyces sp. CRPSP2-6A1]
MTTLVTTAGEFTERWRTPPNLRVGGSLAGTGYDFPPAPDVLDVIRRDEEVRFTILGDEDWSVRMDRTAAFRTAPLEEVLSWSFRLVHFDLSRFYDGLLGGFQQHVMVPWRTQMSGWGFTWQRCAPILFLSTAGVSSTYHNDNSHGLVWQIEGTKTFHSYNDPDKHLSADAAVVSETTGEEPPEHDPADRQSVRMDPGDRLWSHALTPHWVTTESPVAMSVTLAHGGLCHQGRFSDRELALRAYWDRHPEEAWKLDLRNVRY